MQGSNEMAKLSWINVPQRIDYSHYLFKYAMNI